MGLYVAALLRIGCCKRNGGIGICPASRAGFEALCSRD
jgi:hypothetical protein